MAFDNSVWNQLKSVTCDDLIRALLKDGWTDEEKRGATRGFFKEVTNGSPATTIRRRVVIHYHPKKTYGKSLLTRLIEEDIGWTPKDLVRLKLIKRA